MKNVFKWFGIIALTAIIGFSFSACGGADDGGDNSNPFIGSWTGSATNLSGTVETVTIIFTENTWTMTYSIGAQGRPTAGTYTRSGNTATLTADTGQTQTITITGNTIRMGEVTLTKGGGSGNTTYNGRSRETAIPLTENIWEDANIGGREWFKFTATAATQYLHYEAGPRFMGYYLYDSNDTFLNDTTMFIYGGLTQYPNESRLYTPKTLTVGSVYYIHISVGGEYESLAAFKYGFRIGFNKSTTTPVEKTVTIPTTNVTTLTANTWTNFTVTNATSTYSPEQWFKFTATAATQYIHSSLTQVYVYDSTGKSLGTRKTYSPSSWAVTSGSVYYIKVYAIENGAYRIGFNTGTTPPPETMTDATTLTADTWADGNLPTRDDVQWFKFTATAATQYIHANFGTLTYLYVQVYNSSGTQVGNRGELTRGSGSTKYTSQSLTVGQEYYIKAWPGINVGTYQIGFNARRIPPGITTTLTADVWADGNLPTGNDEQWFKFIATAATQYIHAKFGTLTLVVIQVYDSSGTTVGDYSSQLSDTNPGITDYRTRTLTVGQEYFINVKPLNSTWKGTYQIGFNAMRIFPDITTMLTTTLTADTWADGNLLTSSDEQWFKFTATAPQYSQLYIHVSFGTLTHLRVQVYDSSGATVGNQADLYGGTRYIYREMTEGQEYYIKVLPGNSGTYRIGFTTSATAPSS